MTEALVVTVRDLQPQTPELFAHYVDIFSQWLQRPKLATEVAAAHQP